MPTILKGKRVTLRLPARRDFAQVAALSKASKKFHRGLISMAQMQEDFDKYFKRSREKENAFFLICRAEDKAIAGMINISQIFMGNFCSAYLGYDLGVQFTGQGLMTDAIKLMLRHAFEDLKLHRLEANVQPENLPSLAVLEKCGFSREGFSPKYLKVGGRWRDHERWAIIKDNWKQGG
jgi:ribosomal-protein-alanine N-acetyltransferase